MPEWPRCNCPDDPGAIARMARVQLAGCPGCFGPNGPKMPTDNPQNSPDSPRIAPDSLRIAPDSLRHRSSFHARDNSMTTHIVFLKAKLRISKREIF